MHSIISAVAAIVMGAAPAPAARADATPKQRFEAVLKEFEDLRAQSARAYEQAKTAAERDAAQRRKMEWLGAISGRAVELARANPNDPIAIEALGWVLRLQQVPATRQALELLARDHVKSGQLIEVCKYASNIFGRPDSIQAERFLRDAVARNPVPQVRGYACFDVANFLVDRAKHLRWLRCHPEVVKGLTNSFGPEQTKQFMAADPEAMLKEADSLLDRVIRDFADLRNKPEGATLGEQARARLFRLRNLQVGCEVPEIDGRDADGQRFRLSDYRGRVVLLTFCGNWCGSCRALYPKERELIRRLAGKPFVVLSVNDDEDKETLRQSIRSGEITWRCWWDGGKSGPISRSWSISYEPTIFVIDARGKIRYEDVVGTELDDAVSSLVEEVQAPG